MARAIHVFPHPDRRGRDRRAARKPDVLPAGRARQPGDLVMLEKQQVAVLARRIAALLIEIKRRFGTRCRRGRPEDLGPLITVDAPSSGSARWA